MKKILAAIFSLLLLCGTVIAKQERQVALVMGIRTTDYIVISERQANRLYRQLKNKRIKTRNEELLFAALVNALGVRNNTLYDCRELNNSERARLGMGSRYEASKCKVRKLR